jgi:DNA invertase Pin-like site-specific DNA recombinase
MSATKKAVIYARVSTTHQNVSNQIIELRQTAKRFSWTICNELIDDGISGAKGRRDRPAFDRLFQMIQRRECDVVMAWSIDRLGRSIADLTSFMGEVQATGVDLYIEKQAINTATPSGRMIFGIFAALGEYEREIIRERIHAGLARAKAEGKKLGRPSVASSEAVQASVRLLREKQMPIHQIAKSLKIGVGTVSKILKAA